MDKKIKVAAATSLLALTAAACTPNPYYTGYNYGTGTTARTTNTGAVNRGVVVSHTHCGRTHSHALPAEGLAHHHGDGCLAGSGGTAPATNTQNYNYGYNQPPATTSYGYTAPATTPYYDYSAGTGSNYNANAGTSYNTATSGSYYDYVAPKTPVSTYRSPASSSASSTSVSSGDGFYTVQKGDTVFQVMRNTGVYWKDLIRLNNLEAPNYVINPGQRLRLK